MINFVYLLYYKLRLSRLKGWKYSSIFFRVTSVTVVIFCVTKIDRTYAVKPGTNHRGRYTANTRLRLAIRDKYGRTAGTRQSDDDERERNRSVVGSEDYGHATSAKLKKTRWKPFLKAMRENVREKKRRCRLVRLSNEYPVARHYLLLNKRYAVKDTIYSYRFVRQLTLWLLSLWLLSTILLLSRKMHFARNPGARLQRIVGFCSGISLLKMRTTDGGLARRTRDEVL